MNIQSAVKKIAESFRYRADKKSTIGNIWWGDFWFVMPVQADGTRHGDCDDFAVTAIWERCDRSIVSFVVNVFILHRFRLYRAQSRTGPHIVGSADGFWFDNWTREALSKEQFLDQTGHRIQFVYPGPVIMYFMLLGLLVRNRPVSNNQ